MSIENPTVIDFVSVDAPSGEVILVMVEGREWDGSNEQLFQLQEKINSYVSFVLDGQMVERYPELAGKPVSIELRSVGAPDAKTARFLRMVSETLGREGFQFRTKLIGTRPSA